MVEMILPMTSEALSDPHKWNSEWEALFPGLLSRPQQVDQALTNHQTLVKQTVTLQWELTKEALGHFISDNLEARWMQTSVDVRGERILRAFAAVCSKARNLNAARAYAPEIRPSSLQLDGLALLNLSSQRCLRMRPIGLFTQRENLGYVLRFTLRSFLKLDLQSLVVSKEHKSLQNAKNPRAPVQGAALKEAWGRDAAGAWMKAEADGHKARMSQRVADCAYLGCGRQEPSDSDGSAKFSRCKPCFDKMKRQVLYCSAKCQNTDRKLRHKSMCRRPLDFDTVSNPIVPTSSLPYADKHIGLPVDGYKRSIALVSQVTQLNESPTVDYYLYDSDNKLVPFNCGEGTHQQILFRRYREIAMSTGLRESVGILTHYMSWYCAWKRLPTVKVTESMIVAQLAREFDFAELREHVIFLQELQNEDPAWLPPLCHGIPPDMWREAMTGTGAFEAVVSLD
ncbi:hypothetical protein B0H11DRAFT_1989279 [Mycena galericulata]|nr:hypothetical protein B0H11DRAFT_1989279 [Mycena galericulata]